MCIEQYLIIISEITSKLNTANHYKTSSGVHNEKKKKKIEIDQVNRHHSRSQQMIITLHCVFADNSLGSLVVHSVNVGDMPRQRFMSTCPIPPQPFKTKTNEHWGAVEHTSNIGRTF